MWEILSFNHFVTQNALIFFYYIGAVIIPVILLFFRSYLIENISYIKKVNTKIKNFFLSLNATQKTVAVLSFILMFLCMELCWRMMFETMIGYFDMHDYLYEISRHIR
jgi:hypothetical protein